MGNLCCENSNRAKENSVQTSAANASVEIRWAGARVDPRRPISPRYNGYNNTTTDSQYSSQHNITNSEIMENIKRASLSSKKQITFLLLGIGNSGKTTVFKQLFELYSGSEKISTSEMEADMKWLRKELLAFLLSIVDRAEELHKSDPNEYAEMEISKNASSYESIQVIRELAHSNRFDACTLGRSLTYNSDSYTRDSEFQRYAKCALMMWNEIPGIQNCFRGRGMRLQYNIPDNLRYWMTDEKLNEVFATNYEPSQLDYLMYYDRTTGSSERRYNIAGWDYRYIDTGGERSERKKWELHYEEANIVFYIVALNHFRDVLWEDRKMNALTESLNVFEGVLSNPLLFNIPIVLLLNKMDLFRQDLKNFHKLSLSFGDEWKGKNYEPPRQNTFKLDAMQDIGKEIVDEMGYNYTIDEDDVETAEERLLDECVKEATDFIKKQFLSINKNDDRTIYCHVLSALNSGSVFMEMHMIEREIVQKIVNNPIALL